jgi:hypothetical protein
MDTWFNRRPLVGWVSGETFSLRVRWSRAWLPVRARGTLAPAAGGGAEVHVELGIPTAHLVGALVVAAYFFAVVVLFPADLGNDLASGILFAVWMAGVSVSARRWHRRADELLRILAATCEAAAGQPV